MRASGNGNVSVCVQNLLRLSRGEVPYERVKGLAPGATDSPMSVAGDQLQQDAEWLLETYEPRATVNSITAVLSDGVTGDMKLVADITEEGE